MKYNLIKKANLNVSKISLGSWVFGGDNWSGSKKEESIKTIKTALDLGINLIDTAPVYGLGLSEEIIGQSINNAIRENIIIATKCGLRWEGKRIFNDLSSKSILHEIDQSLLRLKTDYIDIYQCHWPDPKTNIKETFDTLLKLQEIGKIKHFGVSNFNKTLISEILLNYDVLTTQNQYSVINREIENNGIMDLVAENNIGLLAYGPLAGGILSGKYKNEQSFSGPDARNFFYKYYKGNNFQKVIKYLEQVKTLNKPLAQIAINWILRNNTTSSVLCGARTPEQIKNNVESISWDLHDNEYEFLNKTYSELLINELK